MERMNSTGGCIEESVLRVRVTAAMVRRSRRA